MGANSPIGYSAVHAYLYHQLTLKKANKSSRLKSRCEIGIWSVAVYSQHEDEITANASKAGHYKDEK